MSTTPRLAVYEPEVLAVLGVAAGAGVLGEESADFFAGAEVDAFSAVAPDSDRESVR
jgi:hypothetical protein